VVSPLDHGLARDARFPALPSRTLANAAQLPPLLPPADTQLRSVRRRPGDRERGRGRNSTRGHPSPWAGRARAEAELPHIAAARGVLSRELGLTRASSASKGCARSQRAVQQRRLRVRCVPSVVGTTPCGSALRDHAVAVHPRTIQPAAPRSSTSSSRRTTRRERSRVASITRSRGRSLSPQQFGHPVHLNVGWEDGRLEPRLNEPAASSRTRCVARPALARLS